MDTQTDTQTDTQIAPAQLRHDPISHYHWLDFGGYPGDALHQQLKAAGWRWSRYRDQYYTNRRFAQPPAGIAYEDAGACDYSAERAERLEDRAERHDQAATAAYTRSNDLVKHIPLGQPILRGHHSERGHRATLEKSRRAMDRCVEESAIAADLHQRAEASARHQQARADVGKLARRRDRLAAEVRKMERDALTTPTGIRSTFYDGRLAILRAEIAELGAAIEAAGGEPGLARAGEAPPFKKGDYIKVSGFAGIVLSIGPKSVTINTNSGGRPWPLKVARNRFQAVLATAEQLAERAQAASN